MLESTCVYYDEMKQAQLLQQRDSRAYIDVNCPFVIEILSILLSLKLVKHYPCIEKYDLSQCTVYNRRAMY